MSSPGPHWDMSGVLFRDQLESFSATPPLFLMTNFLPNIFNLVKPVVSSVAQPCLTLCNPMDCSTPDIPVYHQLPEFTQTHVHRVRDAIQPSHPLSSPLLLPPIPPSNRVFSNESTLHMRWSKYWSFSFSRTDLL